MVDINKLENEGKVNFIYLRTSTEEQNPQNQLKDCQDLCSLKKIEFVEVIEDKVSGWTELDREGFNKILDKIRHRKVTHLVAWDLDRLYRNRKRLIDLFALCKAYGCKIHSVRQQWLEDINSMPSPWNEIVHDLMLQIMGWLAEEESNKKSERVKLAIKKNKEGVTISYKGNKWGRKQISQQVINKVLSIKEETPNISIRDIAKQVLKTDKNNNMKPISKSVVHKILSDFLPKEKLLNEKFENGTKKGQSD